MNTEDREHEAQLGAAYAQLEREVVALRRVAQAALERRKAKAEALRISTMPVRDLFELANEGSDGEPFDAYMAYVDVISDRVATANHEFEAAVSALAALEATDGA